MLSIVGFLTFNPWSLIVCILPSPWELQLSSSFWALLSPLPSHLEWHGLCLRNPWCWRIASNPLNYGPYWRLRKVTNPLNQNPKPKTPHAWSKWSFIASIDSSDVYLTKPNNRKTSIDCNFSMSVPSWKFWIYFALVSGWNKIKIVHYLDFEKNPVLKSIRS